MRIYLPLSYDLLAQAAESGSVPAEIEKVVAEDVSEEAEYAALMAAAVVSAGLSDAPARRVVLAADVTDVAGDVPRRAWAAVHVDVDGGADPDDDLSWYAVQEIADLLAT